MMTNGVCTNKEHVLKKLHTLFDGIDEPIYVSDPETYKILFANNKFEKLFGKKTLGKKCYKVLQDLNHPCPFCTNKYIFGENLGKPHIWEFQNQKNKHWYKCVDKAIEWLEGKYARLEMAIDITKHKQAEEALKNAEREKDTILNNLVEHVIHADTSMKIIWANQAACESAGLEREELTGRHCYEIWQKRNTPCPECPVIKAMKTGQPQQVEKTTPDGRAWFIRGYPVLDTDGKVVGGIEVTLEITKRKRARKALRESEQFSKSLIRSITPDGLFVIGEGRKIIDCNDAVKDIFGYSRDELIGKKTAILFPDKQSFEEYGKELYAAIRKQGYHVTELRGKRRNGEELVVELSCSGIEGKPGVVAIVRDVTEKKKKEEALRESEEKFRTLAEQSPNMIFINKKGRVVYANKRCEEIMGYKREEFYSPDFDFFTLIAPVSMDLIEASFSRHMKGEEVAPYEYTLITKEGKRIDAIITSKLIRYGAESAILGIITDITKRKRIEEVLRESEELFRSVVENSHDGVSIVDDNFKIVYANDECLRISGYSQEELIGQDFRKFLDEESKSLVEKRYLCRQNGEKVCSRYESEFVRKDGERRYIEIKSSIIQDSQGRVRTIAQLLDITERKRMAKERKRFEERLSALNKYGQSLNMARNLEEIHKVMLKAMKKTLGFEYASILMVHGKTLRLVSQLGYSNGLSLSLPLDGEKGVTVKAARTSKPISVPDVRKEKAYVLGKPSMLSELAVPIKLGKEVLGVLNVENKSLAAFDEEDRKLLEILASHAATAISDIKRHAQLRKISNKLANLMRSSTEIMRMKNTHQRLKVIAKAIRKFGWRRVVISLRDENLEGTAIVTAGLTNEETKLLLERKATGHVWRERLGSKFERFKINEFYYLPWSDLWIRENVHGVSPEASPEEATTYAGVPSKLSIEEMVDWHPQDMLYAPLRTPEGRIVGILSMDDPVDGRKPTRESLAPLELFLHQAAMVIGNAQLIDSLREARKQVETHAEQLAQKVEERTRELKKSQEQLLKAQRLAVIGELAGMVGHDLRNPLTSINGAAYYLKKRLTSRIDDKEKEMLDLIEKNIVYSNKIINDLLDYSREMKLDLTASNPKSIIKEALSLVKIPKNIQIIDLTEDKPNTQVDIGKIKRAFVNVIKNAVDAMPKGGSLTIKTRESNGNLEYVFSDTGVGMSKKTMEKLWTPLFTTKAKGMGFGLSICKRIVKAHGGSISVKSNRGKGTSFTVTIPTKPKIEGGEKVWVKTLESSLLTTTKT